jgi:SAM-dependent methyltransferase
LHTLRVNGEDIRVAVRFEENSELSRVYWFEPGISRAAFRASLPVAEGVANGVIVFDLIERSTGRLANPFRRLFVPSRSGRGVRVPPKDRRQRVTRSLSDELAFLTSGLSQSRSCRAIVEEKAGVVWGSLHSVLDWGCGCGRLTRHLIDERAPGQKIIGVDIDKDNIAWCRQNLPKGYFYVLDLVPPTRFADEQFDLVIGISVMTHLAEACQFQWLAELRRLLRPKGYVLLSISSNNAVARATHSEEWIERWRSSGFDDRGINPGLQGCIPDDTYYRDCYHTKEYVSSRWSEFFEILAIEEDVFGYQDAVLMQRR